VVGRIQALPGEGRALESPVGGQVPALRVTPIAGVHHHRGEPARIRGIYAGIGYAAFQLRRAVCPRLTNVQRCDGERSAEKGEGPARDARQPQFDHVVSVRSWEVCRPYSSADGWRPMAIQL